MAQGNSVSCYLAPLEGITGYVYRCAVRDYFGKGIDKFFTPFFSPQTKRHPDSRAMRDVLPENNPDLCLIPQMLTNAPADFLAWERDMRALGYTELNLNIGCPSGTVVGKKRGAGFLAVPEELDHFLEEVFAGTQSEISVKTRLGMRDPEEWPHLLEIYEKYPLKELIIHVRTGAEMYGGKGHREAFSFALSESRHSLVYNGDIVRPSDAENLPEKTAAVMCGRGMIRNPALIRMMQGGEPPAPEELRDFLNRIMEGYLRRDPDENHLLLKMKEIWSYMGNLFPEASRENLRALKARSVEEFRVVVYNILRNQRMVP